MQFSRRDFLKHSVPVLGLATIGGLLFSKTDIAEAAQSVSSNRTGKAVLYNASKCAGCRACEAACRRWNGLPPESKPTDLSPKSWTVVTSKQVESNGSIKRYYGKRQCMHCIQPTCVTVCPAHALSKTELGPVVYDETKCIGCKYCVMACPFSVPRFDSESNRRMTKCTFCVDRITDSLETACVEACPYQALIFGEHQEIIASAQEAQAEGAYVYGMEEAGGTSWIYLSDIPFEERGFSSIASVNYPSHSGKVWLSQLATVVVGATALGLYSLYLRRRKIEEGEEE